MTVNIITRQAWAAVPPRTEIFAVAPVKFVFLTFLRSKLFTEHELINDAIWKCCRGMRYLQEGDIRKDKNYSDIRYNFVIGEDGNIYEGRGFGLQPSLPRRYKRIASRAIYVGLMGDFSWRPTPECMYAAITNLIEYGMIQRHINPKHLEFNI